VEYVEETVTRKRAVIHCDPPLMPTRAQRYCDTDEGAKQTDIYRNLK
jgi:hypothetical protein